VDVLTLRVDRFGEGRYSKRVFVLYTGIHYDAIAMATGSSQHFDQTQFVVSQEPEDLILKQVLDLASEWKKKGKYTDLANFSLKCARCQKVCYSQTQRLGIKRSKRSTTTCDGDWTCRFY
jgi:ubiquitin thioesterase OTU1